MQSDARGDVDFAVTFSILLVRMIPTQSALRFLSRQLEPTGN